MNIGVYPSFELFKEMLFRNRKSIHVVLMINKKTDEKRVIAFSDSEKRAHDYYISVDDYHEVEGYYYTYEVLKGEYG